VCIVHSEIWEVFPISLVLSERSHNTLHLIVHVIVDSDDMMQSPRVPFQLPQGEVLESPTNVHDELHNSPFILCLEEWPVVTVCWIVERVADESS
jgi:hypothetical protein